MFRKCLNFLALQTSAMKRFTKVLFTAFVIIICQQKAYSQYYFYNSNYYDSEILWEVGASFGLMNGMADVGRKKFSPFVPAMIDWKSTKTNGSFYVGVNYQNTVGLRAEIVYGSVAGADSNGTYTARNLSYKTSIREILLIGELHPLLLLTNPPSIMISPYLAGGIGYLSFNPQAKYQNRWVDLQPLSLEGQGFSEYPLRKVYKLNATCFVMGGGLKHELSQFLNVRLEGLLRITTTDFLDDASTTSIDPALFSKYFPAQKAAMAAALSERHKEKNPNFVGTVTRGQSSKDKYLSINLKLGIVLGRQKFN